jgi:hypothetical protein
LKELQFRQIHLKCDSESMYTLRFPIRVSADRTIGEDEGSVDHQGLTYSLNVRKPYHVIKVQGFSSEQAAKAYIHRIWAGLMWLLLNRDVAPGFVLEVQAVTYPDDPLIAAENLSPSFGVSLVDPVDGLIDGSQPAVYLTDKQIRTVTLGDVSMQISTPSATALALLVEGATHPRSDLLIEDQKLRLAFELYGASFTESSNMARFLTLIMALEALTTPCSRTQPVLDLLNRWKQQADELLHSVKISSEDRESLEALCKELLFRRDDSLRRRIYNMVRSTFEESGDEEADQWAKKAKRLYDVRSKLVHEGDLPENLLSSSTSEAKLLVQRVLRAKYTSTVR